MVSILAHGTERVKPKRALVRGIVTTKEFLVLQKRIIVLNLHKICMNDTTLSLSLVTG